MSKTMKAVRLHAAGDLRLDEVPIQTPGTGEVRIAVWRSGIELNIAKGTLPAPNVPLTLGHELSDTIEAVGNAVHGIGVGDRVMSDGRSLGGPS